ncbi:hypothetical protein CRG98_003230 [Punica granatum]|uniref:Uncharacterized protein n=1 Tax=Punica granatum TaxID=22663 RepID=A0A2I0L6I1_PUNGR|nr:hypothetical protein CRG98_003230 [Punica granatum]
MNVVQPILVTSADMATMVGAQPPHIRAEKNRLKIGGNKSRGLTVAIVTPAASTPSIGVSGDLCRCRRSRLGGRGCDRGPISPIGGLSRLGLVWPRLWLLLAPIKRTLNFWGYLNWGGWHLDCDRPLLGVADDPNWGVTVAVEVLLPPSRFLSIRAGGTLTTVATP